MIDWRLTSRILSDALSATPQQLVRVGAAASAAQFQNKAHGLALSPIVLQAAAAQRLRTDVEAYVALVATVVRLYRAHSEVRRYFDLPSNVEELVLSEPALSRDVVICRLDGYLTAAEERLTILENNADSPAGTLFTGRLNRLVRDELSALSPAFGQTRPSPFDSEPSFLNALLSAYRENGGIVERPAMAILQLEGKANVESMEMVSEFKSLGVNARLADPRSLELAGSAAYLDGVQVDLVWNKINTVFWNDLVRDEPRVLANFRRAVETRSFVHVNPFATRYVAENKLCIPFLLDQRFAHLFDASQLALARRLLPWATKLEPEKIVEFGDQRLPLSELIVSQQNRLVLKQPYDIRGDGVTIGRSVSTEEWRQRVAEAYGAGGSLQAYVRPCSAPVAVLDGSLVVRCMNMSLDTFVFNGQAVGFGSKASLNDKVNVFQGGSKVSITVAAEGP